MAKLIFFEIKSLARIRWLWIYFLFLALGSFLFNYLGGDETKVLISLLSISLLVVPLVAAFFGITYFYDSRGFLEFLLSQPVGRGKLFTSRYLSLNVFLTTLYVISVLLPFLPSLLELREKGTLLLLTLSGIFLTLVFTAIAFLVGLLVEEKAKGVSVILGLWLYLTFLHDGLILTVVYIFKDYPLEKVVLFLTLLNPVDLARVLVILNLDIAAIMGLTGSVFKELLGSWLGITLSLLSLTLWFLLPFMVSLFLFKRKDF
ncbi:ABC transporter permease subunit [Aquifex sp.]